MQTNKMGGKYQLLTYGGHDIYIKLRGHCPFGIEGNSIFLSLSDEDMLLLDELDTKFSKMYSGWKPMLRHREGYPAAIECSLRNTLFYDNSGVAIRHPLKEQTYRCDVTLLIQLANISIGEEVTTLKPRAMQVKINKYDKFTQKCVL